MYINFIKITCLLIFFVFKKIQETQTHCPGSFFALC